jgi:hypothetical protein
MSRQEVNLERRVVTTLSHPGGEHTDGMRDDSSLQRMQVEAAPSTAGEVEVIVAVAKAQPTDRRPTPPFLVAETSVVRQWPTLARDDEVDHELAGRPVGAEILEVDATEPVKSKVEIVPTLVVCLR